MPDIIKCFERMPLWNILLAMIWFELKYARSNEVRKLTLQGFLPMTGKRMAMGGACLPAISIALRHINERQGLLDDYNLTYSWVDTKCDAGVATYRMAQVLNKPPTKIMLLGCGCSTASEATAQVSHLYNLTQISYGSSSPILSDRRRFPNFFRIVGPDQKLNPAKIALMKQFNWKRVATINQAMEFFSVVIDDFVQNIQGTDITIVSQEIFQHDPTTRVENLKNRDARIIITACYEDKARLMLCAAYKFGLYGPKIVWLFPYWYNQVFWRLNLEDVPCSEEEMEKAVDGTFQIGFFLSNPVIEKGIAGLTVPEFRDQYRKAEDYKNSYSMYEDGVSMCYDHVWLAALALNCTDSYLKQIGHEKSLAEFTYEDSDVNQVILSCMSNISIIGLSGKLSFGEGADPIKNVRIERIENGKLVDVGKFIMEQEPTHFEWLGGDLKWKGGHIPRDSTFVMHREESIPIWLYATMMSLAGMGILVALSFFLFNIVYRNNPIVKLSSPNINNILLLGCVLTYITVFMNVTEGDRSALCKARTLCFSLGFTLAFGALFSKTWRVYKIFTNKKLLRMTIKDFQLIGLICTLSCMIIVILIVWEIMGPQFIVTKDLTKDVSVSSEMGTLSGTQNMSRRYKGPIVEDLTRLVYLMDNDTEIRPFVRVCSSAYGMYFSWTIYILEGALLSFGAFLAWETRHVKIEALNDSHQIGMCLYNVVVLSAVGLTFNLLLEERVVMVYGINSGCVLIGTTLTQTIVFVPKVMAVYGYTTTKIQPGKESQIGSITLPSHMSAKTSTVALQFSTRDTDL